MWTDKEIVDSLKKGMVGFVEFLGETKLGYLTFMLIAGLIIISILGSLVKYFLNHDYSLLAGICGFMIPAMIEIFFGKKHKNKIWW